MWTRRPGNSMNSPGRVVSDTPVQNPATPTFRVINSISSENTIHNALRGEFTTEKELSLDRS